MIGCNNPFFEWGLGKQPAASAPSAGSGGGEEGEDGTGGDVGITLDAGGLPSAKAIVLAITGGAGTPPAYSWYLNEGITATVSSFNGNTDLTSVTFKWFVDGTEVAEQTNSTLTFTAQSYAAGTHRLTVQVTEGGLSYTLTKLFVISGAVPESGLVSLNPNGGGGAGKIIAVGAGNYTLQTAAAESITAPANKVFAGWCVNANGTGATYQSGETVPGGTVLYAKWGMAGTGTSDDPYIVSDAADLAEMASGLDKYYKLADNITLSNDWAAVGNSSSPFTGSLDGDGHTVTFSGTVTPNSNYVGLFGYIGSDFDSSGTVKNLNLAGTLTVSSNGFIYAGAVAGILLSGNISNVKSAVEVNATATNDSTDDVYAGGIVGYNGGNLTNCYATGAVSAIATSSDAYAGGIAEYNGSTITNCYAKGAVSATSTSGDAYAGGIVGYNYDTLSNNVALNPSVSATTSGTVNAGRVAGSGSGSGSNNWAIDISGITNGAHDNTNGANFGTATTKTSWTTGPDTGPGWTIAESVDGANETNPWWWSTDGDGHPALWWE
jgi:hypothetical protein